jgi:hypothetical protein
MLANAGKVKVDSLGTYDVREVQLEADKECGGISLSQGNRYYHYAERFAESIMIQIKFYCASSVCCQEIIQLQENMTIVLT